MRLLFITDTHIRGNSPKNRKDNFPETLQKKLEEVALLAQKYKVQGILHGGDLFDLPCPSLLVCSTFIPILKNAGVPIYCIAGNHDLFGQNPHTLERTMLGFLNRIGIVKLLNKEKPTYLSHNGIRVQLTGQHYHYEMDRRAPEEDYIVKKEDCDYGVHLVHGLLYNRKLPEGVPHTLIDKIIHTEADVTISGHNHFGFEPVKINDKLFLNPGSLVRLTNHPIDIKRKPKALLLEFTKEKVDYTYLFLESAPKGEEVLDRSAKEESLFQEEKLQEFVKGIRATGDYEKLDLEEIIKTLAEQKGLSKEIKEKALEKIAIARERLEMGESE